MAIKEASGEAVRAFAGSILHGDPEHQAWLLEAAEAWISGDAIPATRSGPLGTKPTNPKDAVGIRKAPMSCLPCAPLMEAAVGMMEGALKYGRHNYRDAGVRASVYYDAFQRHGMQWWEGEDVDPDSKLNHITKIITDLLVLRDSMIRGNWVDDRPPRMKDGWLAGLNAKASALIDQYPNPVPAHIQADVPAGDNPQR